MLKTILSIGIILFATVIFAFGQNTIPNPTPTPFRGRAETGIEKVRRLDRDFERIQNQAYANLYGQGNYAKSKRYSPEWRKKMTSLYRKPDKAETEILKPAEKYFEKYSDFLTQKDTGIIKLIPDQGCEEGGAKVINASPNCTKYNFPGAGSSYSFRLETYRIRRLADITLIKNSLSTRSILNGAIFVVLGDVPIENVNLNTPELEFLKNYKPVRNAEQALKAARLFAGGVKKNGFIYGRGILISPNQTYAMRSIAYRGKYNRSENGVVYNELDFDKRRDVIVTFRIVEIKNDGSATIVWKILHEAKSPKLKISKP